MPAFHPTFVKAIMPPPHLTPATLTTPRKRVHRNRTLALNTRRFASGSDVVLIGWQPARWAAPTSFQLTYAAVPTRAGWLFFQL